MLQLNADPTKIFPNGVYVFHSDGTQVDPKSPEGITIEAIWQNQSQVKQANTQQRIKFAWETYPRDDNSRKALLQSWGLDPNSPAPHG